MEPILTTGLAICSLIIIIAAVNVLRDINRMKKDANAIRQVAQAKVEQALKDDEYYELKQLLKN